MRNTRLWVRLIHKWLGLVIGLQVLLWIMGGLVMAVIPIDMVRGSVWVQNERVPLQSRLTEFSYPLGKIEVDSAVANARVGFRLGDPAYVLTLDDDSRIVVHANTGVRMAELSSSEAAVVATTSHVDPVSSVAVNRVETAEGEIRGAPTPLWRVTLDDRWNSRVYVDAISGRVVATRNDLWRFYDFFWMLHIMDYGERDDFNNNLLRSASFIGLFISLTGIWMLFHVFGRGQSSGV